MKTFKIAALIAGSFLTALFTMIAKVDNTEIVLYKNTLEILMQQEEMTSEEELKVRYPILTEIQSNMNQIANLNQMVLDHIKSPAPMLTEEETLHLERCRQKISELREEVRTDLSQLQNTYSERQP